MVQWEFGARWTCFVIRWAVEQLRLDLSVIESPSPTKASTQPIPTAHADTNTSLPSLPSRLSKSVSPTPWRAEYPSSLSPTDPRSRARKKHSNQSSLRAASLQDPASPQTSASLQDPESPFEMHTNSSSRSPLKIHAKSHPILDTPTAPGLQPPSALAQSLSLSRLQIVPIGPPSFERDLPSSLRHVLEQIQSHVLRWSMQFPLAPIDRAEANSWLKRSSFQTTQGLECLDFLQRAASGLWHLWQHDGGGFDANLRMGHLKATLQVWDELRAECTELIRIVERNQVALKKLSDFHASATQDFRSASTREALSVWMKGTCWPVSTKVWAKSWEALTSGFGGYVEHKSVHYGATKNDYSHEKEVFSLSSVQISSEEPRVKQGYTFNPLSERKGDMDFQPGSSPTLVSDANHEGKTTMSVDSQGQSPVSRSSMQKHLENAKNAMLSLRQIRVRCHLPTQAEDDIRLLRVSVHITFNSLKELIRRRYKMHDHSFLLWLRQADGRVQSLSSDSQLAQTIQEYLPQDEILQLNIQKAQQKQPDSIGTKKGTRKQNSLNRSAIVLPESKKEIEDPIYHVGQYLHLEGPVGDDAINGGFQDDDGVVGDKDREDTDGEDERVAIGQESKDDSKDIPPIAPAHQTLASFQGLTPPATPWLDDSLAVTNTVVHEGELAEK